MRNVNEAIINAASDASSASSSAFPMEQVASFSVHAVFSDGGAAGTIQVQVSNEPSSPTKWVNAPSGSATVASGASVYIAATLPCRWMRVTWAPTAGAGTVTCYIDTQGY